MKKFFLVILSFVFLSSYTITQDTVMEFVSLPSHEYKYPSVHIRKGVDTTNVIFQEIFQFWQNYQYDSKKLFFFKDSTINIKKYWADSDYNSPDLIANIGLYYFFSEYLIGIEKRNDTLYEIQTIFYSNITSEPELKYCLSIFVTKEQEKYKLCNKLSMEEASFQKSEYGYLHFYYPNNYAFNEKNAKRLSSQVDQLISDWGLSNIKPIKYYLFSTYTEMLYSMGINIGPDDFFAITEIAKMGKSFHDNRQIFYTKGGENYMHEVIHILICDLRNNGSGINFDEGVCSYFGDHQGLPYAFHAKRLKEFLNQNSQIDLGINLVGAYLDSNKKYTYDTIWREKPFGDIIIYTDPITNYTYIILGAICEIAYKKGGIELIKQMILKAKDGDGLYDVIEKNIGIKRKDINDFIREHLNTYY